MLAGNTAQDARAQDWNGLNPLTSNGAGGDSVNANGNGGGATAAASAAGGATGGAQGSDGYQLPLELVGDGGVVGREDIMGGADSNGIPPENNPWNNHRGGAPAQRNVGGGSAAPGGGGGGDILSNLSNGPFSNAHFDRDMSSFLEENPRAISAPPNVAELRRSGVDVGGEQGGGGYERQPQLATAVTNPLPEDVRHEEFYEDFYRTYSGNQKGAAQQQAMSAAGLYGEMPQFNDIARQDSAKDFNDKTQSSLASAFSEFGLSGARESSHQGLPGYGGPPRTSSGLDRDRMSNNSSPSPLDFQAAYAAALIAHGQQGQYPSHALNQQQMQAAVAAAAAAASAAAETGDGNQDATAAAAAAAAAAAMAATAGNRQPGQMPHPQQMHAAQVAAVAAAMQWQAGMMQPSQQNHAAAAAAAAAAVAGGGNYFQRYPPMVANQGYGGRSNGHRNNDGNGMYNGHDMNDGHGGSRRQRSSRRRIESTSAIVGDTLEIELEPGVVSRIAHLSELSGRTLAVARDQNGCRFLQRKFDEGGSSAVAEIFDELLPNLITLMTDPFGNYLFQKLVERCNDEQRMRVLREICVSNRLVEVSLNTHGTRAVQKVIEMLSPPQEVELVTSALSVGIVELIKDLNGNHVVQRCLQRLAHVQKQFIYDAACSHCVEIASHRHGCCVLQRCIDYASPEQRNALLIKIASHGLELSQDPFGNYVVQYVLELGAPWATERVMQSLQGSYYQLSMQKFSSNVVEKCLKQMDSSLDEQRDALIKELSETPHLGKLLQDPYANYVVQRVLSMSTGDRYTMLVERIRPFASILKTSPYGKRILAKMPLGAKKGMKPSHSSGDMGQDPIN